jgi:NAD+ diphosphatase
MVINMTDQFALTFSGSGLDRAAHMRGTPDADPAPTDRCIVLWRGKVFIDLQDNQRVVFLSPTHPMLATAEHIFLGVDDAGSLFAYDISSWTPDPDQLPPGDVFYDPTHQSHPDVAQSVVFAEPRGLLMNLTPREAELVSTAKAMFHWHHSHRFCAKCGHASNMVMSGWQRTCSNCSAPHFPRTDPVVIMLITHGNNILLGRSHPWPAGMYSCLAGFVEPGETIEAAVRREVLEETNIKVGEVRYVASQPWAFPNSLMFGCHGDAISTEIEIDPAEIEHALWVSRSRMLEILAGNDTSIFPARPGSIAHYLIRNWVANRV